MNTTLGFFPYEAMNYKAAQAKLDRRAARGWELKRVYLGCVALFRRADRPSHFVDLDLRKSSGDPPDSDYLQLCADAGWELVQSLRGMLLFRAAPGQSPAPIQTDGELEWERFWDRCRPRFWSTLLALFCIGVIVFVMTLPRQNTAAMLASGLGLLYLLYFTLAILSSLAQWIHSWWYLAKCRRTDRVEAPGPAATVLDSLDRLQAPLLWLILFFLVAEPFGMGKTVDLEWYSPTETYTATVDACRAWPVVLAADLGLGDGSYSRHLDGHGSILVDFLEYRELAQTAGPEGPVHYTLTTERYDCLSGLLARWVLAQRREETRNGAFLWGALDWQPAPGLAFDECYISRDSSYLLFRQGKVVALVGCSDLDLTDAGDLEIVRARVLDGA